MLHNAPLEPPRVVLSGNQRGALRSFAQPQMPRTFGNLLPAHVPVGHVLYICKRNNIFTCPNSLSRPASIGPPHTLRQGHCRVLPGLTRGQCGQSPLRHGLTERWPAGGHGRASWGAPLRQCEG